MTGRPSSLPTTEDHRVESEEDAARGRATLLAAFPKQVAVPLPASGSPVGRAWLDEAGLLDSEVSREHLRFTWKGSRKYVEDCGSRHGTFLDGERLTKGEPVPLEDGAVLRLGNSILVYREDFTGTGAPAPPLGGLAAPWGFSGVRAALARIEANAKRMGQRPQHVLIEGDTGTGKELVAAEVARAQKRGDRFVPVNVAALSPQTFEGQLFGWKRGAFSGSVASNRGIFRANEGGAVFLDEIGELPVELQPKLLRLIENGQVLPLGENAPEEVNVAVIAATNRNLREQVKSDAFRLDLLSRFHARIALPRLADRPEDLFAILEALWPKAYGPLTRDRASVEAIERLMLHDFPGNVRDVVRLLTAVDPAVGLRRSVVQETLGLTTTSKTPPLTREAIAAALAKHKGNQSGAARELGVTRARLLRAMKKHSLE